MAPPAVRRGARVLVVLLLAGILFVALLVLTGVSVAQLRASACARLGGVVPIDRILPACAGPAKAGVALRAAQAAVHRHAFREALEQYRVAAVAAPDVLVAHVGHGEAAEILGEYDEALAAFQRATALAPSADTSRRVAGVAERLGRVDLAVQSLGTTDGPGPWREHASVGVRSAAAHVVTCLPMHWPNPVRVWQMCVAGAREAYGFSYDASHGAVQRWVFRVLVEDGRRDRALEFARERGWLRQDADYCGRHGLPLDDETAALLAILTQPDRADCAVPIAVAIADDGGARLARLMLLDRIANSPRQETRQRAQYFLRYRLPDHNVPRLAEALNIAGWRLQHVHDAPDDAIVVFQKAIDADPSFSWPHHNIGRLFMNRGDYEQARVWLERAVKVNPDHWRALYNYGVTSANLKRWPDALGAYRKALAISPNDARLHANVGWTLMELGQQAEGERALQIAVRLDPSLQAERAYLNARYGADARSGPTPVSTR